MNAGSSRINIGLGTVQFGTDYGISNTLGHCPPSEVRQILASAEASGIGIVDTAPLYGNSEEVLGQSISSSSNFRVVTKTPTFGNTVIGDDEVRELDRSFTKSLSRLKLRKVYGLLVHRVQDLMSPGGDRLIDQILKLKEKGCVEKVGVSIYNSEQIDWVNEHFPIDLIQVPANVLDQRLLKNGYLDRLRNAGVEIHVRSIFLQGLLLLPPKELNPYFDPVRPLLEDYHDAIAATQLSPLKAALLFAAREIKADSFIVGVCSRKQLDEIIEAASSLSEASIDFPRFAVDDKRFIDPSNWPPRS
jgi:aryl-alcohol dehydrogenase-like predicted oxidoreductase